MHNRCKLCGKEIKSGEYCEECAKKREEYLKNRKEEEKENGLNNNVEKVLVEENTANQEEDKTTKQVNKWANIIALGGLGIGIIYIIFFH